jgi:hypothetical protein
LELVDLMIYESQDILQSTVFASLHGCPPPVSPW